MTDSERLAELERILAEIIALCRRYASPVVNPGAHALASKVLELAGEPK